jgi:hypothetical protein
MERSQEARLASTMKGKQAAVVAADSILPRWQTSAWRSP